MTTREHRFLPNGFRAKQHPDGSVTAAVNDFEGLRHVLGDDLLGAFCMVFAASNRLASLEDLTRLNMEAEPEVVRGRNMFSILVLAAGVAHESVAAINTLQKALRAAECKSVSSPANKEIQSFVGRWNDRLTNSLRDKFGFHFDRPTYMEGAAKIPPGPRTVVAGHPPDFYFPIADDVLLVAAETGMGTTQSQALEHLICRLWVEQKPIGLHLATLFVDTVHELGERPS